MLEDCQPRHQPGGQRRPARLVRVNRAKLLAEKVTINRPRQLGECVPGVDDLIQPCPQQVMLAAIARFLWSHLRPQKRSKGRESQNVPSLLAFQWNLNEA